MCVCVCAAYDIDENDALVCYVTAMYWSIMTITSTGMVLPPSLCMCVCVLILTVCVCVWPLPAGYGDIVPVTPEERLCAILCMLVGAGVFAYTIGSVSQLMSRIDYDAAE